MSANIGAYISVRYSKTVLHCASN